MDCINTSCLTWFLNYLIFGLSQKSETKQAEFTQWAKPQKRERERKENKAKQSKTTIMIQNSGQKLAKTNIQKYYHVV